MLKRYGQFCRLGWTRFVRDENAATAIEYAVICILMTVCIVGALMSVANPVGAIFTMISEAFPEIE